MHGFRVNLVWNGWTFCLRSLEDGTIFPKNLWICITVFLNFHQHFCRGLSLSWIVTFMDRQVLSWIAWIVTFVDRHFHGSSLSWIVTFIDRHFHGSLLSWIVTFMDRHFRESSLSWIVTFMDRHFHNFLWIVTLQIRNKR